MNQPSLDIVIPVYNEIDVLPLLFERLKRLVKHAHKQQIGRVQLLFVDDGSTDATASFILEEIEKGTNATLIRLSRNFGHQSAVTAGIEKSTAQLVAIIDADLQDPPELIFPMVRKWRTGIDIVYAIRRKRKENWIKRLCYWSFYRLLRILSDIDISVDAGDFCLMDRRAVNALCALPEKIRFPRGLRSWIGFRQEGIEYERAGRAAGRSKYPFRKLYQLATEGIASLSIRPLKITQLFSFIFAIFVGSFSVVAIYQLAMAEGQRGYLPYFTIGYALTALSSFMVLFSLYIISGYVARIYLEAKGRPSHLIMEIVDEHTVPHRKNRTPHSEKSIKQPISLERSMA